MRPNANPRSKIKITDRSIACRATPPRFASPAPQPRLRGLRSIQSPVLQDGADSISLRSIPRTARRCNRVSTTTNAGGEERTCARTPSAAAVHHDCALSEEKAGQKVIRLLLSNSSSVARPPAGRGAEA